MDTTLAWPALALGLGCLVLAQAGWHWLRRLLRRSRGRARARRAAAGERDAEALLRSQGYRVVERQPARSWTVDVDGEPKEIEVRADLLVERRGRCLVAEIKTGAHAPSIESSRTRRQLLEYRLAYADEADGVLLVDMEQSAAREVLFPGLGEVRSRASRALTWLALGCLLGAGLAVLVLRAW